MAARPSPHPELDSSSLLRAAAEQANEGALDALLEWLGCYVPSWGTSMLLHVVVLTLAAFIVWQGPAETLAFPYETAVVSMRDLSNVTERDPEPTLIRGDERADSWGRAKPRAARPGRDRDLPNPGIAFDPDVPFIGIIGIGADPRGGHEDGWGDNHERGGPGPVFPPARARRIVFVVDASGSMTDSFDYVRAELKDAVDRLDAECEFHVIFFSTGPAREMPTRRLVRATDRNKRFAFEFIDSIIEGGGTDPTAAIERAFAVRPDAIQLLTDGEFDRAVVDLVARLNTAGRVRVDTIAFLYEVGAPVLKAIADANGGAYRFVSGDALGLPRF
jgi:hypothetical protein